MVFRLVGPVRKNSAGKRLPGKVSMPASSRLIGKLSV